MNPEFPQNEREQLEAKLTAFLLGELPPDEVVALCKAMDQDPELAALYEKLKLTIGFVREGAAKTSVEAESQAPLKLSEEKREKLLTQFKTIAPNAFAKPRRSVMESLVLVAACLVMVGMLAALLLPSLASAKRKSMGGLARWDTLGPETAARHSTRAEKSPSAAAPVSPQKATVWSGRQNPVTAQTEGERVPAQAMTEAPRPAAAPARPPVGSIVLPAENQTAELGAETANQASNNPFVGRYAWTIETHDKVGNIGLTDETAARLSRDDVGGLRYVTNFESPLSRTFDLGFSGTNTDVFAAGTGNANAPRQIVHLKNADPAEVQKELRLFASTQNVGQSSVLANRGVVVDPDSHNLTIVADDTVSQQMLNQVARLNQKSEIVLPTTPGFGGGVGFGGGGGGGGGGVPTAGAGSAGKTVSGKLPGQLASNGTTSFDPTTGLPIAATRSSGNGTLETRTFKVDPNRFYAGLQNAGALSLSGKPSAPNAQLPRLPTSTNGSAAHGLRYVTGLDPTVEIQTATVDFFRSAGANLDANKGESVFFNDRQGTVTIHGTSEDLDKAQAAIDALNQPASNVTVAARFVAVEEQDKKVPILGDLPSVAANASSPAVWMTADRLKELASMRVQKEADYQQQAALLEQLKSMSPDERKKALPIAYHDNQLSTLLSELDLAQQNLIRLKTDYAPNNPKSQSAQDLVNDLNRKVNDREDGILLGLESKVAASKAFLDTISNDIASAQRADIEGASNAAPYFAAKEELEDVKRWRQILAMRTGQEQVEKDLPRARMVTIVDAAVPNSQEPQGLWEKIHHAFTGKVESTARIDVEQEHPDISGLGTGPIGNSYDPYFLLTEFETIHSDAVLSKVIDAMSLQEVWGKKYNGGQPMSKADVEARIKSQLDLKPVPNSKLIEIKAYSDNPEEAAKLANQIAESYRQYRSDEYQELKNHGIQSLQYQLAEQDKKVQLAQAKVDELAKQLNNFKDSWVQEIDRALPKPVVPPPTPQPEMLTRENAFSTFSLNVSDVSFKLAAASLEKGQMPESASIRSEEFINAFDYRDPEAPAGVPIAFASERARYPFAHNRELLRFSLKTAAAGRQAGRPLNIVLLLDNSGSMERADRVRIIQEALHVLAGQLNARDTFSIVTFARTARLRVDGIHGDQAGAAATEIARLTPEGGTNLGDALDLAYETALKHYLANGDNRVVVLTDGAANLGDVNPDALKQKVEAHRKQGVALDCFGIGWEDYNDDLLEVLTRNGDGRYGFINSPEEADTTFVSQIAGALHVAAADVKVQVEFNPKRVISYRQIGYAKHQLTKEQFRDNTVDAAEIAAQEAGNALYTIEINPQGEGSVATVHVRYKVPGTSEYREQAWDVPYTGSARAMDQASPAMRLAATASAFSEWLATSPFADEVSTDALLKYLNGVPQVYGADKRPAKLEWMIRQAKSISGK